MKPAPPGSGLAFVRTDLPGEPAIRATTANVGTTSRCTGLRAAGNPVATVLTVEHLLAACVGTGLDNAVFALSGGEVPAGDGSAATWADLIAEAGLVEQPAEARRLAPPAPVWVSGPGSYLIALPAGGLQVTYVFTADEHAGERADGRGGVGNQYIDFVVTPETFRRELAPARTIAFLAEIEALRNRGLALGGTPEQAVVIGPNGYAGPCRFPDEPARHKALDLLGDLALIGPARLYAHVIGIRSGHALNAELAKRLFAEGGK